MTVGDYLHGTRRRFRRDPTPTAVRETIAEFARGLRRRRDRLAFRVLGDRTIDTELAGVRATFHAENDVDAERARSLNREQAVAEWLLADCDDGTVLWDVGAHHGHYAVLAALQGATVVAFEPDAGNRERIARNAVLNGVSPTVRPEALSDTDGEAAFGGESENELAVGAGDRTVETRRGDGIDPAPTVVKLDVEGHELAALDGMAARLGVVDRIAVEVHDGVPPGAVRARLDDAGLELVELGSARSQTYLGGIRP
ncbi:MAG: FkbM family methyltransferase [Natronomonas sp.]|nr:FkbM family methyltransferase [Natronomonas sp.]